MPILYPKAYYHTAIQVRSIDNTYSDTTSPPTTESIRLVKPPRGYKAQRADRWTSMLQSRRIPKLYFDDRLPLVANDEALLVPATRYLEEVVNSRSLALRVQHDGLT